jgi:hypothetical protein
MIGERTSIAYELLKAILGLGPNHKSKRKV